MKHINLDEILKRRRESKVECTNAPEEQCSFLRCVDKQLRQINDQTIEHLIRIALRRENLSHDHKLDLLQVIACKSGVHINKHSMINHVTLIYLPNVTEIEEQWHKSRNNYFVLKGAIQLYEQRSGEKAHAKFNTQPASKNRKMSVDDEELKYPNLEEFQKYHSDYAFIQEIGEFRGIGELFGASINHPADEKQHKYKLASVNAIIAIIEETELEHESIVNDGIAQEDKLEILNYFPVLRVIGKKLNTFINNFKVKEYSLKQLIYKKGEKPKSVYFLIRGQVNFELVLEEGKEDLEHGVPFIVNTESVAESNYFGEEEIVFKAERVQSAKVVSSKCVVLQLDKEKFEKMLENPQLNDLITRAARIKRTQRLKKIQKAKEILNQQVKGGPKLQGLNESEAMQMIATERLDTKKRFSNRRRSQINVKMMHGHIIKQSPPKGETIHFSMLEVNPDMYVAAKKKFRKYDVKPLKYDPRGTWDFKKVWKILNLQDVLQQEQIDISAPQGRKFYDCHRRFQQQISEAHSLRPKTTSSNYRTKLQYIAYLQQFNH